jgi:hypothetical protein
VAATLIAALGLSSPAGADGWSAYPPPGFAPPPSVSLFSGNAPQASFQPPPRRYYPPQRAYGYDRAYGYRYGYNHPRYNRSLRGNGGRTVIIVTR